jgi:hypothetical protein
MATVMNSQSGDYTTHRRSIQKVCVALGVFFVLAGFGGIIMPGMLGMHLSLPHNIIHLASGALCLWVGLSDDTKKAYNFAVAFGVVYGLLGVAGFVFGQAGYPGVGHMEADQNLLRIIPNVLEFGTMDHGVHILLSAGFLVASIVWKRQIAMTGRSKISTDYRSRDVFKTSGTTIKKSDFIPSIKR